MQLMILYENEIEFSNVVNHNLKQGFTVIPGSTYVEVVSHKAFFSTALWREDGEIFIKATNPNVFRREVNDYLGKGFKAVPGTTYFKNLGDMHDNYLVNTFYIVFLNKD